MAKDISELGEKTREEYLRIKEKTTGASIVDNNNIFNYLIDLGKYDDNMSLGYIQALDSLAHISFDITNEDFVKGLIVLDKELKTDRTYILNQLINYKNAEFNEHRYKRREELTAMVNWISFHGYKGE